METYVNDSAVWRTLKHIQVNDGGVWRTVSEAYVNDAGTWRTVFKEYLNEATLTAGTFGSSPTSTGFILGFSGSYSDTATTDGHTVSALQDLSSGVSKLSVSGFGADPGIGWLYSVDVSGTTKLGSSASYSYSAGIAIWEFATLFGMVSSNAYSVTIK